MNHDMKLNESPYIRMESGEKTIEIRLFDKKRQEIKLRDEIIFSKLPDLTDKLHTRVTGLLHYQTFSDLLDDFDMSYFDHPNTYTKEQMPKSIYSIYTREQEEKYGVLGIQIQIIKE